MRSVSSLLACLVLFASVAWAQEEQPVAADQTESTDTVEQTSDVVAEITEDGENVRYITDDLYTFLHAGPGRNYRILGSVIAGSKVIQLQQDADSGFIEIIDERQRTGWVDAEFITEQISIRESLPELQAAISEAQQSQADSAQDRADLVAQVSRLTEENASLQNSVSQLQEQNAQMEASLGERDQNEQMEWFTRGGIVSGASVLLGIIIASLLKRRRRSDNWM